MKRKIYDKLLHWKNHSAGKFAVLLEGARRVGKSYIVKAFAEAEYERHLILDFSEVGRDVKDLFRNRLRNLDEFFLLLQARTGVTLKPGRSLVVFDEVQRFPRAREAIKPLVADGRFHYLETGSLVSIRKNVEDIVVPSEELKLPMHPMDFEEFLLATGMKRKNIDAVRDKIRTGKALSDTESELFNKRFAAYSVVGGLPEAVDAFVRNGANGAQKVLKEISSSYADAISDYNSGHDVKKTQQCYCSVPCQLCDTNKRFTYARIDDGGSRCSAEKYGMNLHWLERSGYCVLSRSLSALNRPLGKYTSKDAFKAYMSDSGLLMSMMSAESRVEALMGDTSFDFGAVTENAVAGCLSKCGYGLSYYRRTNGMDKMEIDSVIDCDGLVCIEVKTGAEREYPSLRKTLNDPNVSRRVIFEKGNILTDEDGIEHYPLFAAAFLFPENEQIVDDSELSGMFGDPFTE